MNDKKQRKKVNNDNNLNLDGVTRKSSVSIENHEEENTGEKRILSSTSRTMYNKT
jgi:hypothetical protein